jgi:hypothetical protein
MRDDDASEWLGWELYGYPTEVDADWFRPMERWTNDEQTKGYFQPVATLSASLASGEQALRCHVCLRRTTASIGAIQCSPDASAAA